MKNDFGCPVQGTINVLSGKWKVLVVWHLGFMPRRFAELRNLLPGVSDLLIPFRYLLTEFLNLTLLPLDLPL